MGRWGMEVDVLMAASLGAEAHRVESGRCLGQRETFHMLRLRGRWLSLGLAA